MRLILIRHGETEHNRGNITLGRFDAPLNERGRAQARAVAASFVRSPDAVFASPLARALETAESVGSATRVAPEADDGLIEMDVGDMEHLTSAELRYRYPNFLRAWLSDECADARMPGGETLREVQDRAWGAIERFRVAHSDGTVVAVTHNFVILTLICRVLGLPLTQFRRMRPALGSKSVIDVRDGAGSLVRFNDISHLVAAGLADDLPVKEARP
jgi:probable phosphoglycerate mutase